MAEYPTVACQICGRVLVVRPDGRGFPPAIAKRRLARYCAEAGHVSDPKYLAGISASLAQLLAKAVQDGEP